MKDEKDEIIETDEATVIDEESEAPPVIPVENVRVSGTRSLVIYEASDTAHGGGRMFALDPTNVGAVPVPAFRMVTTMPGAGVLVGEAILNTTTGIAYVWDGGGWAKIVPPVILSGNTDNAILSSSPGAGTYMFSKESGNFFVRFDDHGTDRWRQIGITTYPTETALKNDLPPDSTIAYAVDTGNYYTRQNGNWVPMGVNSDLQTSILSSTPVDGSISYATDSGIFWVSSQGVWHPLSTFVDLEANIMTLDPNDGATAYSTDTDILWYRIDGNWMPASTLVDTDAHIQAATQIRGRIAVATDTGKFYISDGTSWIGQPWRDYPTEAALLAATPTDGTMAVALDTGLIYYRAGGNWLPTNRFAIPNGNREPDSAHSNIGDLFFNSSDGNIKVYDGAKWQIVGVGSLIGLADVDLKTTAPQEGDTLVYDNSDDKWKPKRAAAVVVGTEPPILERFHGMLWWTGGALFLWDTANVWVEV